MNFGPMCDGHCGNSNHCGKPRRLHAFHREKHSKSANYPPQGVLSLWQFFRRGRPSNRQQSYFLNDLKVIPALKHHKLQHQQIASPCPSSLEASLRTPSPEVLEDSLEPQPAARAKAEQSQGGAARTKCKCHTLGQITKTD